MRRVLLAVDLSYQTYRAASVNAHLTSGDGEFTGGLYGFMVTLAKAIRDTEATHVLVCEDRKPYRRSLLYPEYKLLRRKTQDLDLKARVDAAKLQILGVLDCIGIPVVGVDGFEADDIIAHTVHLQRHRFKEIFAASNDSDLYRLFQCPWFKVYRKDINDVMDFRKLKEQTGLSPEEFSLASALMGTHNDIEGIKGVGEKTAYRAVKDLTQLRMYRERHSDLIERNLRLIKIPYEGFPGDLQLPPAHHHFDRRKLIRYCSKYDINVTGAMTDSFEAVCP